MRVATAIILLLQCALMQAQNPLVIPPALTGAAFNLTVQTGTQIFYGNTPTPTYGINGHWMSPTIIVNKDDSITLNVINNLPVKTTMHWHGLHVSAMNDGGPHQSINPNTTWSPSFKVRNNASTFWYHPHGAGQTDPQVSKGLAGLLIVKDAAEAALDLPRTYGIDDIPIIVQSKSFDDLQQIAIASDMDTALFVNGTLNPYFNAPSQVVRFRLLNGSSLRSYNFGLSNGQTFYQIGTDGGLLDTALALTRLRLSPGERAEIVVNFSGMNGQTVYLRSYASELADGIYGAAIVGMGADTIHEYGDNFLNGADFDLLRLNIGAQTGTPVTTIPTALIPYTPIDIANATSYRTIVMDTIRMLPIDVPNRAEGPFGMNNQTFDMDVVNDTVHLNTTEVWTLVNKTLIAHPFHIHDIQFNIIESSGLPPAPSEAGWKDVVLVMPGDTVKFITKFETFADDMTPYMYHCHLLHHEDDGMMGSFIVIDTMATGISESTIDGIFKLYPNPATEILNIVTTNVEPYTVVVFNSVGQQVYTVQATGNSQIPVYQFPHGMYLLKIQSNQGLTTKKIIKS